MKPFAHVVITDDTGSPVWTGDLRRFFLDNRMDRRDRRRICEELRPSPTSHLQEPVFLGGGAGVEFKLQLIDERVRPRRRCEHGAWPLACPKCYEKRVERALRRAWGLTP